MNLIHGTKCQLDTSYRKRRKEIVMEDLIECVEKIKEYCGEQRIIDCFGGRCMFSDGQRCMLNREPCEWDIDREE